MSPPTTGLILVVDDNEVGRYSKARILRDAGYDVIEGPDGVLLAHVRGRHLEDRHGRGVGIGLEAPAHLPAVEVREVHVEEDEAR